MRCHYCVNELAGKQFPTYRGPVGNLIPKGKLDQKERKVILAHWRHSLHPWYVLLRSLFFGRFFVICFRIFYVLAQKDCEVTLRLSLFSGTISFVLLRFFCIVKWCYWLRFFVNFFSCHSNILTYPKNKTKEKKSVPKVHIVYFCKILLSLELSHKQNT